MKIIQIGFEEDRIVGITDDGRKLWQSLAYYRRLREATAGQREKYEINSFGIHWEELDEDISFESFEYPEPEPSKLAKAFLLHPELNASAVARRLGMKQSLLAAYINGTKKPSANRAEMIIDEIHAIGEELSSI